jgi:hypothetical protein
LGGVSGILGTQNRDFGHRRFFGDFQSSVSGGRSWRILRHEHQIEKIAATKAKSTVAPWSTVPIHETVEQRARTAAPTPVLVQRLTHGLSMRHFMSVSRQGVVRKLTKS